MGQKGTISACDKRAMVRKVANVQIKLSIREELLERLESALGEFPTSRTTNLIACEVIEDYLDLWLEAERYRTKKVKRQFSKARQLRGEGGKASKKASKRGSEKASKKKAPGRK